MNNAQNPSTQATVWFILKRALDEIAALAADAPEVFTKEPTPDNPEARPLCAAHQDEMPGINITVQEHPDAGWLAEVLNYSDVPDEGVAWGETPRAALASLLDLVFEKEMGR